ncbi:MAG TPA: hypothetical protein VK778_07145, partial [Solirubrobacteraceae bacterium]|nr:hypothetical protein [Solirubrobacteraceae bacterium]
MHCTLILEWHVCYDRVSAANVHVESPGVRHCRRAPITVVLDRRRVASRNTTRLVGISIERPNVLQLRTFLHIELTRDTPRNTQRRRAIVHERHTPTQRQQRATRASN